MVATGNAVRRHLTALAHQSNALGNFHDSSASHHQGCVYRRPQTNWCREASEKQVKPVDSNEFQNNRDAHHTTDGLPSNALLHDLHPCKYTQARITWPQCTTVCLPDAQPASCSHTRTRGQHQIKAKANERHGKQGNN